jgi:ATP-dependent DNA ligase
MKTKGVPAGDNWQHEIKFGGFRLQVIKDGPTVRLIDDGVVG